MPQALWLDPDGIPIYRRPMRSSIQLSVACWAHPARLRACGIRTSFGEAGPLDSIATRPGARSRLPETDIETGRVREMSS